MVATSPPAYVQGGTYSASLDRLHQITGPALPAVGLAFGAREGCFVARMPAFSNSTWTVTVGPCAGYVTNDFSASVGDYSWCNPSNAAVTLTASSGTLNRIDLIGLQVKDNFLDSSGLNSATVAVVQGTAVSGTASPPATPNSFIPILQASVPAGSTGPTLTLLPVRTGPAGIVLPVANATERATITNQYEGMAIWRIDRKWVEVWSVVANGWLIQGTAVCTTTADRDATITTPFIGQSVFVTADNMEYVYGIPNANAWTAVQALGGGSSPSSTTLHEARYYNTNAQSIPNSTDQRVQHNTALYSTADVTQTTASGGSVYTFNRAGLWQVETSVRIGGSPTGVNALWLVDSTNTGGQRYAGNTNQNVGSLSCSTTRRFSVGDKIAALVVQSSGGALNIDTSFGEHTSMALTWLRP